MAVIKKTKIAGVGEKMKKRELLCPFDENVNDNGDSSKN